MFAQKQQLLLKPDYPLRAHESGQAVFMVVLVVFTLLVGLAFVAHWSVATITQARAQSIADAVALAAVSGGDDAVTAVMKAQSVDIRDQLEVNFLSNSEPREDSSPNSAPNSTLAHSVLLEVQLANQSAYAAAAVR